MMTSNELKEAIKNEDLTNVAWEDILQIMADPSKYCLTFGEILYLVRVFTDIAKAVNSAVTLTQTDAKKINERLSELSRKIDIVSSLNDRICILEERFDRIGTIFSGEDQW